MGSYSQAQAIWTAVMRQTLSGQVPGPDERVSPYAALAATTRNVAHLDREDGSKGTITAGKTADLVILDANPLTVAPETIRDIKVVETIKHGRSIYQRG